MTLHLTEASIHCDVNTVAGSQPLLFLHSALATSDELAPLRARFPERTTILLDLPGHGKSTTTRDAIDTAFVAECILAALDKLSIESVDMIGYSLGGYIGLEMAVLEPTRVRSVVSHAMKYYWTPDGIEAAVATFSKAKTNPETIRLLATLLRDFNTRQLHVGDIQRANIPLLLTTGALDEFVTPQEVKQLATAIGMNARCEIIEGARHSFRSLPLDLYESLVREFWKTRD